MRNSKMKSYGRNVISKKIDWSDVLSTVLSWSCVVLFPVTILITVIVKIKNEIGFWGWLLHGMPDIPHKRWYALTLLYSIGFCGLCLFFIIADIVQKKILRYGRTAENYGKEERQKWRRL